MTRPAHRQGPRRKGMAEQRAVDAYELWMEGATYDEIAATMECSKSTAHDRVTRGKGLLRGDVADKRDRIAMQIVEVMGEMQKQALPHEIPHPEVEGAKVTVPGDYNAANSFKGLSERFSKLYGLDSVVKAEVEHSGIQNIVLDPRVLGMKPQEDTEGSD